MLHVHQEVALVDVSICICELAFTTFHAIFPSTFVGISISEYHFTLAMPLLVQELAFIYIAVRKRDFTFSTMHVIFPFALVDVAIPICLRALPMLFVL